MHIERWIGAAVTALIIGACVIALATGLTFWNLFWILVIICAVAVWILALQDIWRRADLSRAGAIVWSLGVLFFPFLGTLVYFFARPPAGNIRYKNEVLS
jgi:hypothetical protein